MPIDQAQPWYEQANLLRQALAEDKRPLAVMIGAGCPLSIRVPTDGDGTAPLIPDVAGLTKAVGDALHNTANSEAFQTVIQQLKDDGATDPNLEHILTHIRSLAQAAGSGDVRGLNLQTLRDLDSAVSKEISEIVNRELPADPSGFSMLSVWIGSASRSYPIQIFTTNYDLLIEQALEREQVPYFDGFVGSRSAFFDPFAMEDDLLPARWARLWKLHGSINWEYRAGQVYRLSPERVTEGRLIYPSHLKYDESRRMPYLAMADRMRDFFRQSGRPVLVSCGYSFSDEHVNDVITKYYFFGDRRVAMRKGFSQTLTYIASNHLGSTGITMDSAGNLGSRLRYHAFGQIWTGGTPPTDKDFTGYTRLGQRSGFDYAGARFYSADLGRFLSVDPIGGSSHNPQSHNLYAYVRNNPLSLSDRTGLCVPDMPAGLHDGVRGCGYDSGLGPLPASALPGNVPVAQYAPCISPKFGCTSVDGTTYYTYLSGTRPPLIAKLAAMGALVLIDILNPYDDFTDGGTFLGTCAFDECDYSYAAGVLPGVSAALVKFGKPLRSLDELASAANAPYKNGFTKAGHSLQKHTSRINSFYRNLPAGSNINNPGIANALADELVVDILTTPGTTDRIINRASGPVLEFNAPNGLGVRFDMGGNFLYFREPPKPPSGP